MTDNIKIKAEDLRLYYGENHALNGINMGIRANCVTAFIGPSGCGKSTFLKTLNRMNDLVDNVRIEGRVTLDGEDIYAPGVDVTLLRKRVGMVFQQPNPFPMSIYDNIAYGPRVHGIKDKGELIDAIGANPGCGEYAADMLMVNKYLERIGDHATNIAEWVIFSLNNVDPEAQ